MEVSTWIGAGRRVRPSVSKGGQAQTDNRLCAFEAANRLNSLHIVNREYDVIRDPNGQGFLLVAIDRTTGAILDQFVPEEILNTIERLSGLSAIANQSAGEMTA
jgi:hypothetical protein